MDSVLYNAKIGDFIYDTLLMDVCQGFVFISIFLLSSVSNQVKFEKLHQYLIIPLSLSYFNT